MKTWDVLIVGGGIIGLSLSIALRKRGAAVLLVERREPGREASHAAGGMLVDCALETAAALQTLATASARMYPEFSYELEAESGMKVDLRDYGTILIPSSENLSPAEAAGSNSSRAALGNAASAVSSMLSSCYCSRKATGSRERNRRAKLETGWPAKPSMPS